MCSCYCVLSDDSLFITAIYFKDGNEAEDLQNIEELTIIGFVDCPFLFKEETLIMTGFCLYTVGGLHWVISEGHRSTLLIYSHGLQKLCFCLQ